jgi:hypothetical protein
MESLFKTDANATFIELRSSTYDDVILEFTDLVLICKSVFSNVSISESNSTFSNNASYKFCCIASNSFFIYKNIIFNLFEFWGVFRL